MTGRLELVAATSFGVSVGVRCPVELASIVREQFPPGCEFMDTSAVEHLFILEPTSAGGDNLRLRRARRRTTPPQSVPTTLSLLQNELHLAIAENAKEYVFIHAGVVAWNDQLILFPGRSHAGKSTLVWSLIQSGGVYYSDEYAVLDERGRVHPFALPISLRSGGARKIVVQPERIASLPASPALVVFAQYQIGNNWQPQPLRPAEAAMSLMRHCIALRKNPGLVLPAVVRLCRQTNAYRGIRGEAEQLLDWLIAKN